MPVRRVTLLLWIPLVMLCTWGGIWWQMEGTRWKPDAARAMGAAVSVRALWSRRIGQGCRTFLDPGGTSVAVSGPPGFIRILDGAGRTTGERALRAVDAIALTGTGNLAAVFQRNSRADGRLTFLRLDASDVWEADIGAPISDVSLSVDGRRAACVTRNGHIYSIALGDRPRFVRWRSVGRPVQAYVAPDGSMLAVATADPPGVYAYTPDGRFGWKAPNSDPLGEARIFASPDGRFLACVLTARAKTGAGPGADVSRLVVMSASGRQQWGARLRASSPEVALSADGRYAAITYTKVLAAGEHVTRERKVVFFETGAEARQTWQHGGPFYDPRLVALAADGAFVVTHDGGRRLFFFSANGQELWRHRIAAPIRAVAAAADGRLLLVYARDGSLTLLRVSGPGP